MAFGRKVTVPEKQHSRHAPDGQPPAHIKKSEHVGAGHEDSMNRLPDPNQEWGNEESGEGKGC